MQIYDTTFIINPQTDDASIDRDVRSVADLITKNGGKILEEDRMGTRRLAYDIRGLTQGYYTCFIYEAPSAVPKLLDRHFHLGEGFLRHLTIRFDGELRSAKEEAVPSEAKAQPVAERPAAPAVAPKAPAEEEPAAETEAPAEAESAEAAPLEPVSEEAAAANESVEPAAEEPRVATSEPAPEHADGKPEYSEEEEEL